MHTAKVCIRIQPYMVYELDLNLILPVHFTATVGNSRFNQPL